MKHEHVSRFRGFSVIECAVLVVVLGMMGSSLLPMLSSARHRMRGMSSAEKLMAIGQAGMMYAGDNADRLFGYSWRAGESYVMPDGRSASMASDVEAAGYQNTEILMRHTGRISGVNKILNFSSRIPHRRFSHLVLLDYLGMSAGSDLFIDPSDGKQAYWSAHPLEYGPGSSVPYANGYLPGYDSDSGWQQAYIRQRWAFASSYQVVPAAWQPDPGRSRYIPVESTPHLLSFNRADGLGDTQLSQGRRLSDVLHNAHKVWMFEEFDRDRVQPLYFGYDDARVEKLLFDGSVQNRPSGEAAPSVVPEHGIFHWKQAYVPLDRFPSPVGGLGDDTPVSQRFRWTFGGLAGINYWD